MSLASFPSRIRVEHYRCFREESTLLLRPLTLIYGRNNAGKSALLRLPRLLDDLARTETRDGNLLRLLEPPYATGGLEALLPRGSNLYEMALTLEWDQPDALPESWKYTLGIDNDTFQVSELEWQNIKGMSGHTSFRERPRKYVMVEDSKEVEQTFAFAGLTPSDATKSLPAPLNTLRERLQSLLGTVRWLHASRSIPIKPLYPRQDPRQLRLKADGSDALELLATRQSELLPGVNFWYSGKPTYLNRLEQLEGAPQRQLRFHDISGRGYEVRLEPAYPSQGGPADFRLTLAEAGEGMSHVLPVLVGLELARKACKEGRGPALVAIEEPESHLHPDAQRALAQHIAGIVMSTEGVHVVLETHSEALLLALQVEVAKHRLSAEEVAINWVFQDGDGGGVRAFSLDENGLPNGPGFPIDAFSDVEQLRERLIAAQP